MAKKVVVIGWDGATFRVLDTLIEKGLMPNLARLKKEGAFGTLESTLPILTPTAWATFATGKNPGHHGCYDFLKNDGSLRNRELLTSTDIKGQTFYEILEKMGKRSICINLPLCFPPRIKKGVLISSFLAGEGFLVHPAGLEKRIRQLKNYRVFADAPYEGYTSDEEFISEIREIEKNRFLLAQRLFREEWDFFFCLFSASDWIQHKVPSILDGEVGKAALALFQDLDKYLGFFMRNVPPEGTLFLISDHGFKKFKGEFVINRWLEKEGYLTKGVGDDPSERARFRLASKSFSGPFRRAYSLLGRFAPLYLLTGFLARNLYHFLPLPILRRIGSFGLEVKLSQTSAYSPIGTYGEIYLNRKEIFEDGVLGEREAEELKKEICKKLRELKNPFTQERAFKNVFTKEEIYGKDCLKDCPDLILELSDLTVHGSLFSRSVFLSREFPSHDREAILFAFGSNIKSGAKIKGVGLVDLAPTILYLLGAPVPTDLDGKGIEQILG